jgi:hypothetical protein
MTCATTRVMLLVAVGLWSPISIGADDSTAKSQAEPAKKSTDSKPAKEEPEFNSPPKGAVIVPLGRVVGQITKGSDGKTFSMDVMVDGKKKEIEINLAASTKVRRVKQSDFDDKGNPKKSAPVVTAATMDDLRGGMTVAVLVSGTRDGKWLVAKAATLTGE